MSLINQIQQDIVNPTTPLSSIMRKARILASGLNNEAFKTWIDNEVDGYEGREKETFEEYLKRIPRYRVTKAKLLADAANQFVLSQNVPIRIPNLPDEVTLFWCDEGIGTLEKYAAQGNVNLINYLPDFIVAVLSRDTPNHTILNARKEVPVTFVHQIIETVRDRLLNFVLELERMYPDWDAQNAATDTEVSQKRITYLVSNHIKVEKGGNMSTFDQREQNVSGSQYNAAGDINFNNAQNSEAFYIELEKVQQELARIIQEANLSDDIATDAEYYLKKATIEAKKENPQKEELKSYLHRVKELLQGAVGAAGIIATLGKAVEVLDKVF